MFAWMRGCLVWLAAWLVVACVLEGQNESSRATEDASGVAEGDAAVRVAIHYVGDAKCKEHLEAQKRDEAYINKVIQGNNKAEYIKDGKNTHRLNGDKAELSSKEFVTQKPRPQLSGDKFLQANNIPRTQATIENHCRRLLLIVDSEERPRLSSDNLAADTEPTDWLVRFTDHFGDFGGQITCGSGNEGELKSLCSFSQINDGNRYFAYLYPKAGEDTIAAEVTYTQEGKEVTKTIMVASIYLNELQFPTTKMSDIVVKADCGDDYGCLFIGDTSKSHELKCRVQGQGCGEGFDFSFKSNNCSGGGSCQQPPSDPKQGQLCTGEAAVAALSEQETSLKCSYLQEDNLIYAEKLIISKHHLAGKLCVVTSTREDTASSTRTTNNLSIEESACGKVGIYNDGDTIEHQLELSFGLAE